MYVATIKPDCMQKVIEMHQELSDNYDLNQRGGGLMLVQEAVLLHVLEAPEPAIKNVLRALCTKEANQIMGTKRVVVGKFSPEEALPNSFPVCDQESRTTDLRCMQMLNFALKLWLTTR